MSTSSTRLSSLCGDRGGGLTLVASPCTMGMAAPPLRATAAAGGPPLGLGGSSSRAARRPFRRRRTLRARRRRGGRSAARGDGGAATEARPLLPVEPGGAGRLVTNRSVTALILRTIGYVPGQLLPLEFGGPLEDFELDARHNYSRREAATRGPRLQPMRGQRAAEASGAGPAASWLASPAAQLLPQSRARPRTPRKRSQMMRKQAAEQPGRRRRRRRLAAPGARGPRRRRGGARANTTRGVGPRRPWSPPSWPGGPTCARSRRQSGADRSASSPRSVAARTSPAPTASRARARSSPRPSDASPPSR